MSRIEEILKEAEKARLHKSNLNTAAPIETTEALVELCRQNGRPWKQDRNFEKVEACLSALKSGNAIQARAYYSQVPLGGNGCFNDWQPSHQLSLRGNKYNGLEFELIVREWSKVMRQIQV